MRALVLGGRGDIGSAIAEKLSAAGTEVVVVGHADFDLSDSDEIDSFFSHRSGETYDVLVHSCGLNRPKKFEELSDAEIRHSLEVNLLGFLRVVRHCLPHWQRTGFGRVLVISSLYGIMARSGRLPYVMSKHALNGAVKTLAIELGSQGVLVNALSPGFIDTRMTRANNSEATIAGLVSGVPVKRLGTPEDVARVAAFLCSSENAYINGQDIIVDGGYSIGGFQAC